MNLRGRSIGIGLTVFLFGYYAIANFASEEARFDSALIPDESLRLGLDLRGGFHWVIGVKLSIAEEHEPGDHVVQDQRGEEIRERQPGSRACVEVEAYAREGERRTQSRQVPSQPRGQRAELQIASIGTSRREIVLHHVPVRDCEHEEEGRHSVAGQPRRKVLADEAV